MDKDKSLEQLLRDHLYYISHDGDFEVRKTGYWLTFSPNTSTTDIYIIENLFSLLINNYIFVGDDLDKDDEESCYQSRDEESRLLELYITQKEYQQIKNILEDCSRKDSTLETSNANN